MVGKSGWGMVLNGPLERRRFLELLEDHSHKAAGWTHSCHRVQGWAGSHTQAG